MTNPLFVAAQPSSATSGTTFSVAMPSASTGDLLIAFVGLRTNASSMTAPSGWTQAFLATVGSFQQCMGVWTRIKQSGDPSSYSWGGGASTSKWTAMVLAYRTVDADPLQVGTLKTDSGFVTAHTTNSLTPDADDCIILAGFFGLEGGTSPSTWTPKSGWTSRGTATCADPNTPETLNVQELVQTAAAAVSGAGTTSHAEEAQAIILAVRPPQLGTLSGTVTDASTGLPISGALVSLNDPNSDATTTDAGGAYAIPNVTPGSYTATITAPGFGGATTTVTLTAGQTTTANVGLPPVAHGVATLGMTGTAPETTGVVTTPGVATVALSASAGLTARLTTAGLASLTAAGQASVTIVEFVAAQGIASLDLSGTASIRQHVTGQGVASLTASGAVSGVRATVASRGVTSADLAGQSQVTASVTTAAGASLTASGTSTVTATVTASGNASLTASGAASVGATVETTAVASLDLLARATVQARVTTGAAVSVDARPHAGAREITVTFGHRLRLDVIDATGRIVVGPFTNVLACEYHLKLDEIGDWSADLPVDDPRVLGLTSGQMVRITKEGEGPVFAGIIDSLTIVVDDSGAPKLSLKGSSTAEQLLWANTLLGRAFNNVLPPTAVQTLLGGTGWTAGTVAASANGWTAQLDGVSIFKALTTLAQTYGWHVREDPLSRAVDVLPAGGASGLRAANVPLASTDLAVLPLTDLTITDEQPDLWNVVVPTGDGEGVNRLSLQYSTRTSPYPIHIGANADGTPYWFIQDSPSVISHGSRTQVLSFKGTTPLDNSSASITEAANALYDQAAAWLGWHSEPQESYDLGVTGLRHYVEGQPTFRLGETLHVQYRGLAQLPGDASPGERWAWKTLDDDLYLLEATRTFADTGADSWKLVVSTTDQATQTDASVIAQAVSDLWAIQTATKPYTYREIHGPLRQSADSQHTVTLPVLFDDTVRYLHQATFSLAIAPVRANAESAASGGGSTSSAGGSHSHSISGQSASSGGGGTSSADGSHSHSLNATSTGTTAPEHVHVLGTFKTPSTWGNPAYQVEVVWSAAGSDYGGVALAAYRTDTAPSPVHTWASTSTAHNHSISAQTANAGGSHSHSISPHTHSVTGSTSSADGDHTHSITPHTHNLVYGIYENAAPQHPAARLLVNGTDITAALGGPWDGDTALDITEWLVDSQGRVLRTDMSIEVSVAELVDLTLTLRSLVSASSITPV